MLDPKEEFPLENPQRRIWIGRDATLDGRDLPL
jgi:hypothetical protein